MSGYIRIAAIAALAWALPAGAVPLSPHEHALQAPPLFWLIALGVVVTLLGFAIWAIYGRHGEPTTSTGRYHALGALVVAMTLFTLILYMPAATYLQNIEPTERAWDWAPGETLRDPGGSDLTGEPYRGYQVYLAQGCTYCHTLYIRKHDIETGWAPGAGAEDVTQPGDFANYPFTLLGTQRNGFDLTIVGRRIPDMQYQIDHLKSPRDFKPDSIMPGYAHLSERDLRDLAAYMVSLGNPPAQLKSGEVAPVEVAQVDPQVERGNELYRSLGCVGCHSVDGSRNVGPTLKGLFGRATTLADGSQVTADEAYIRESIHEPKARVVQGYPPAMPPFPGVSEEDIDALIAFIRSLDE